MSDATKPPPVRLDSNILQSLVDMDGIEPLPRSGAVSQGGACFFAPQHFFAPAAAAGGLPIPPEFSRVAAPPAAAAPSSRKYFKYHMQRLQTTANHVLFYVSFIFYDYTQSNDE